MVGETVHHYRIIEKLGEGGMGEVWKAQDTRLDRFVALKFLPEKTSESSATVERFLREARAASALNHPGICTIHDIGDWNGRRYIVMEYVEGTTLGQRASQGPLDVETIIETGIQLADALDAAHNKSIIHRDIKSTNIILSPRGQAKILDFGLAKIVMPEDRVDDSAAAARTIEGDRDLTDAGQAVGTVSYMSPEQALGKDIDGRTDIFSLGVVLYELATGRQAFPGSTTAAIFDAILNKAPTSPVSLNRDLPPELERIINKTLEKDRDLRYQSAADLMSDLKRMRRDGSSQSVSTAAAVATKSSLNRNLAIAGAVVVIAAVALFMFMRMGDDGPELAGPLTSKLLTSLVGVEEDGTWSPDGSFFAFSHSASGPANIYVMSVNGGDPVELGVSDADDFDPRWSPDNRWIAFSSNREGSYAIYLIPPLGGAVQKLVEIGGHGLELERGVGSQPWSPDSRFYLFAKRDTTGMRSIWKLEVDSGRQTQLTDPPQGSTDSGASWSFDGKQIAFTRWSDAGPSVMIMSSDGGSVRAAVSRHPRWLPEGHGGVQQPAWSPDSRYLVVEAVYREAGMWLVLPGTDKAVPLVPSVRADGASVTRDGKFLYNTYEHQTDLYLQDIETGEARRLTAHTQDNFEASVSRDGSKVVYVSSRTGQHDVWILDLITGDEIQFTSDSALESSPRFSPDGSSVIYVSNRGAGEGEAELGRLWVKTLGGGSPRLLTEQENVEAVHWSPDGSRIGILAWKDRIPALWVMPASGGTARKVLDGVAEFGWYRDTNHVIIRTHDPFGAGELQAVDLESGERVTLLTDPLIELMVAPDGSAVNYCSARSHYNMNLHVLRLEPTPSGLPGPAGDPVQITHGDGEWHVHNGDWSPDARQVVYTRDTDKADMYMLEGVFSESSGP